jgi:UDP-glucose 4-epimerase
MILHPHATSSHSPQRPHTGRALVTGGAGFVGSHIAEALFQAGWRVLVVDDLTTGREGNVPAGAELAVADIRSEAFESAIHSYRPDLVTHAAAQASVAISVSNPAVDASVNIVGGLRVAESAIASGARQFVYINTGGALYGAPRYLPVDEDHPVVPLSPYGLAKWTLECYLRLVL